MIAAWPGPGCSPAELAGPAANGVRASFLDSAAKEALLAEIAAVPLPLQAQALQAPA